MFYHPFPFVSCFTMLHPSHLIRHHLCLDVLSSIHLLFDVLPSIHFLFDVLLIHFHYTMYRHSCLIHIHFHPHMYGSILFSLSDLSVNFSHTCLYALIDVLMCSLLYCMHLTLSWFIFSNSCLFLASFDG